MSGSSDDSDLMPEAAGKDTGKETSENQQTGTTETSASGIMLSTKKRPQASVIHAQKNTSHRQVRSVHSTRLPASPLMIHRVKVHRLLRSAAE
jgi:hypothetical protein